jgi:methylase of polypeptide subunit release factors
MSQEQVAKAFGYKWTHDKEWGMSGATAEIQTQWLQDLMGFSSEAKYAAYFGKHSKILDAGCGNGRETRRLATLCTQSQVTGMDISDAVETAAEYNRHLSDVTIVSGDVSNPNTADTFDCIV